MPICTSKPCGDATEFTTAQLSTCLVQLSLGKSCTAHPLSHQSADEPGTPPLGEMAKICQQKPALENNSLLLWGQARLQRGRQLEWRA